ncbi:ligase-associated DNA damage response endonuclease PdeM [Ideonella sp. TBM-1]|uniref:Ligase-associated DNA damage response endonuclease PdeM n=1 Tax=Ideonella livida TaxID=2707176 RepID=A0A7C9THQ2_9BURK|nr:ligase-associated DNA damage response endonuclease PdeM [Ideonella livida]
MAGAQPLSWQGHRWWLDPQGALVWPARSAVLVADVHLGKARTFRRLGVPVPESTTRENFERLDRLLACWPARQLVVLGDLFHSADALTPEVLSAWQAWRARHADREVLLVTGNHDQRAGPMPPQLGMTAVADTLVWSGVQLSHDDAPVPGAAGRPVVCGHWHPVACLRGRAHDRLRLPCFVVDPERLVLPSFGAFTGGHPAQAEPGRLRFVLAAGQVMPV